MRPKSLMKPSTTGSSTRPKWLATIPTKSIHVMPKETPATLILANAAPTAITRASNRIE